MFAYLVLTWRIDPTAPSDWTSCAVASANTLPVLALGNGCHVIEVNITPCGLAECCSSPSQLQQLITLVGCSGTVLPALVALLRYASSESSARMGRAAPVPLKVLGSTAKVYRGEGGPSFVSRVTGRRLRNRTA
eukprot:g549.t1